MSDNRPIAYWEGDRAVLRASSIGRSVRCLAASLQGYTPLPAPEYLMRAAEAGNRYEVIVKERLRADGYVIADEQGVAEVPIRDDVVVRGHLDGESIIHESLDGEHMLEVKSMSQRVFDKWLVGRFSEFPEYAYQLSTYMEATGKPAVYAVVNRDTDELEVVTFEEPPVPWVKIVAKALQAVHFAAQHQLPDCDSGSQYACPYQYLCDRSPMLLDELESGAEAVLVELAQEYDEVRKLQKELGDRKAALSDEIRAALGDRAKVQAGRWSLSVTTSKKMTPDKLALREELGDRFDEFLRETTYDQLRVTELKVS